MNILFTINLRGIFPISNNSKSIIYAQILILICVISQQIFTEHITFKYYFLSFTLSFTNFYSQYYNFLHSLTILYITLNILGSITISSTQLHLINFILFLFIIILFKTHIVLIKYS